MSNSEILNVMIEAGLIKQSSVDILFAQMFHNNHEPGACPWDLFFYNEWVKEPRDTFDSIVRFYTDDAHTIFQASMMGSWDGSSLGEKFKGLITNGIKVLEYGSGGGREAVGCLKAGADVTICDVSHRLLESTRILAEKNGKNLNTILITEDVQRLPKEQFDFVITIDCLEHVRDPVGVLHELVSCLKVDGYIYNEVFFGGHELSPYHLVETRHFGTGTEWFDVLTAAGLVKIDDLGNLWKKVI